MRAGGSASIRSPFRVICPARVRHSPMMVRSVVVLPAPLRPNSMVTAPLGTSKLTPCRM